MGLQNQLSDVSSESILIIMAVLAGKGARYLRSVFHTIVHAFGIFSPRFDSDDDHFGKPLHDAVGSGLAGIILLCEQMNLNRVRSFASQSDGGCDGERFGSDCVVCLNRMRDGDHVRRLACGHVFHKDCLDGWLGHMNFNCPLCHAPMVTEAHVERTRRRVAGDLLAWFPLQ